MPEKTYLLPAHPFSAAGGKAESVCQASLVEGGAPGWGDFVFSVVVVGLWGFLWERRGPVPIPPTPASGPGASSGFCGGRGSALASGPAL